MKKENVREQEVIMYETGENIKNNRRIGRSSYRGCVIL